MRLNQEGEVRVEREHAAVVAGAVQGTTSDRRGECEGSERRDGH